MRRLIVLLALLATASTPAAAAEPIFFWGSAASIIAAPGQPDLPLVTRPKSILLFADGSWDVERLHWTGWGSSVARATGTSSASNGIPNQAEGKRIKTPARVTLSSPGTFNGHRVYRCFTLTLPKKPGSSEHLCLRETNGYWALAPVPQPSTTKDFLAPSISGGCELRTTVVVCETYGTPAQVATVKASGAVSICVQRDAATPCHQGDFGEGTPHYGVGRSVTLGRFRCRVEAAGVRCTVTKTGKGFLISKTKTVRVG